MKATPKTAHRDEQLTEAHNNLVAAVEQLVNGEDWAAMLTTAARFHRYSLTNLLLLTIQCKERDITPSRFAGYRTWQALGHQVKRGEHGLSILAPIIRRVVDAEQQSARESGRGVHERQPHDASSGKDRREITSEVRKILAGFKVTKVFDISQTDGPPIPEVSPALLQGNAPQALYEGLAEQVTKAGFVLSREDCSPANGRTNFVTRQVAVRPDLEAAQAAKTLVHELAHIHLHDDPKFFAGGGVHCEGIAEIEAESVAYLVCATTGLVTDDYSFPYVARWAKGDLALVRSTGERAIGAARTISTSLGLIADEKDQASGAVLARSRTTDRGVTARHATTSLERGSSRTTQSVAR